MLKIAAEAFEVDPASAQEVVRAVSGGHEAFCPQPHSNEKLHAAAGAFLTIARLG